jgi:hypothetical protein
VVECQPAAAAKLLEARVVWGREVRLKASFGVPDTASPADIWRRLDGLEFQAVGPLAADPAALEVSLAGDIRVVVVWVDKTEALAEVGRLRLVRVAGTEDRWRLPREEVERTGQAAGLDLSRTVSWAWVWAGVAVLVVLATAISLAAWFRSRRKGSTPGVSDTLPKTEG